MPFSCFSQVSLLSFEPVLHANILVRLDFLHHLSSKDIGCSGIRSLSFATHVEPFRKRGVSQENYRSNIFASLMTGNDITESWILDCRTQDCSMSDAVVLKCLFYITLAYIMQSAPLDYQREHAMEELFSLPKLKGHFKAQWMTIQDSKPQSLSIPVPAYMFRVMLRGRFLLEAPTMKVNAPVGTCQAFKNSFQTLTSFFRMSK